MVKDAAPPGYRNDGNSVLPVQNCIFSSIRKFLEILYHVSKKVINLSVISAKKVTEACIAKWCCMVKHSPGKCLIKAVAGLHRGYKYQPSPPPLPTKDVLHCLSCKMSTNKMSIVTAFLVSR